MKKMSWLIAVAAITILFFQCQKEVNFTGGPDAGITVTPDPITASLQGNITDENDLPAAGVMVTAGVSTTITDINGHFRFTNASLDKNTALVTASKDGYFKGYRVFAATSGCNQVAIKLIKKTLAGSVSSASGGEVSLSSGAKVSLPAGSVVMASSNSAYSGDVKVYASYINPLSADISKTVPGSLVANSKDGKRVVLSSYGMLAVELSSASGEKLQIKSGSTAMLTIPIPATSLATAPATIPLWYVNETTGIWQEEGTATRQGNNYVGEVKHFSYWNCDVSSDAVNLSFTLQTTDGNPLANAYVEVRSTGSDSTYGAFAYGYTDSLGQLKTAVPANQPLKFTVYNDCRNLIYTQDVSALTGNTDLGVVKLSDNTSLVITFKGTLLNCNNQPVTNGYVFISGIGGLQYYISTDANGQFSASYTFCSGYPGSIAVLGVDKDAQQQGISSEVGVSFPLTDIGTISACGVTNDEYINYTLDGVNYSITNQPGSDTSFHYYDSLVNGNQFNDVATSISGFNINSTDFFSFTVADARATGTYPVNTFLAQSRDSTVLQQPFNVTFTRFPAVTGEFYEGNLSGTYTQGTALHTVSATFRARRNY